MAPARWLPLVLLSGLAALWLSHNTTRAPFVSNDGTQYVDAAEHLRSGKCLCTSVAHFDEQVDFGHLPVPFTHFAPGYPILLAALMAVGIEPESAGHLISALAFLITLGAMWDIGLRLSAGPAALFLVSLLWLSNALALEYAGTVGADSALAAIFCATVALVVRDIQTRGTGRWHPFAVGIAAAASYWVKYAGLFVVSAAVFYLVFRAWRWREGRLGAAGGIAAAVLFSAPIPIHNILYQGSWKGGFQTGRHHTASFAVIETVKALYHLVFGANATARLDAWEAIAGVSLIVAVVLILRSRHFPPRLVELIWVAVFMAAIAGGVAVVAMQSIANDLLRYNFPVYPLLLVTAAVILRPRTRAGAIAFWLLIAATLVIQSRSLKTMPVSRPEAMRAILNQQTTTGVSMWQWLNSHVEPDGVIVAADGQALHYVLKRPVVSLIVPEFTDRPTDERGFQSLMKQYRSRYVVVYPDRSEDAVPEQAAIPFLHHLASGAPPSWLTLAARTENIAVFECAVCGP